MDYLFLILSVISLVIGIIYAIIKTKLGKKNILLILFIFTALSILLLFIPLYYSYFDKQIFKTLLISIHNTIRIFVIDADFEFVKDNMNNIISDKLIPFYSGYFSVLYILGPCLTAGFLLDFLINLKSSLRIKLCFKKNYYVFSLLNEKSITLAKDIYNKDPKHTLIIFMDTNREDEEYIKLTEDVKKIKSVLFKNKIYDLDLKKLKNKIIYLFLMNDYNNTLDEEITTSLIKIVNKYKEYSNIKLYAFTNSKESELAVSSILQKSFNERLDLYNQLFSEKPKKKLTLVDFSNLSYDLKALNDEYKKNIIDKTEEEKDKITKEYLNTYNKYAQLLGSLTLPKMKICRVDYAKNMIYSILQDINFLFDDYNPEKEVNDIQTAVIGLGNYGKLMTKTLVWYCQVPNSRIVINCFDKEQESENILRSIAPCLFDSKYNEYDKGEACFKLNFMKVESVLGIELEEELEKIKDIKLIFISLGNDELNIQVACKVRSLYARLRQNPKIITVVYNDEIIEEISDAGVKNEPYDITYIGSLKKVYCKDNIIGTLEEIKGEKGIVISKIEKLGLEAHLEYACNPFEDENIKQNSNELFIKARENITQINKNNFYYDEYNYNSSISSAIFYDKLISRKDFFSKCSINQNVNEHRRWDAYVMSVGYRPTEHHDKKERTDLGKMHHDIRSYYILHKDEQDKDKIINDAHIESNKK